MLLQWNKLSKLIAYSYSKIFLYVTYLIKINPAHARNTKPCLADTWIRNQQIHFMEKKNLLLQVAKFLFLRVPCRNLQVTAVIKIWK